MKTTLNSRPLMEWMVNSLMQSSSKLASLSFKNWQVRPCSSKCVLDHFQLPIEPGDDDDFSGAVCIQQLVYFPGNIFRFFLLGGKCVYRILALLVQESRLHIILVLDNLCVLLNEAVGCWAIWVVVR